MKFIYKLVVIQIALFSNVLHSAELRKSHELYKSPKLIPFTVIKQGDAANEGLADRQGKKLGLYFNKEEMVKDHFYLENLQVDFSSVTVAVIRMEMLGNLSAGISIEYVAQRLASKIEHEGFGTIGVSYSYQQNLINPSEGCIFTDALSSPYIVIAIEKPHLEMTFKESYRAINCLTPADE